MSVFSGFEAYTRIYSDFIQELVEVTKRPYLIDQFTIDTDIEGQTKVFRFHGSTKGRKKTQRHERVRPNELDYEARHLHVETLVNELVVDREDFLKMAQDVTPINGMEVVKSIYEMQTEEAMNSFFRPVVVGENAGSTSNFPATNVVPVNYSGGTFGQNLNADPVGLNIDKLMRVRVLASNSDMLFNQNAMSQLNIAVTEEDVQNLQASVIGGDNFPFMDAMNMHLSTSLNTAVQNMQTGQFYWHGFNFIMVLPRFFERDANGNRRIPVWTKDAMKFGIAKNVETDIVPLRETTVESVLIKTITRVGGLRYLDKKVFEIKVV